jgi:chitinase
MNLNTYLIFSAVWLFPFSSFATPPKAVILYIGAYHGQPIEINEDHARLLTHINYAFANVIDGRVAEDSTMRSNAVNFEKLHHLKNINPDLSILVSVGGWTWSKGFSDAVLNASTRELFANSSIEYLKKFKLDGLDYDWEYPGQIGDNNPFRTEDKENFTLALKRVREKLDSLQKAEGRTKSYLLTIATGANDAWIDNTEMDILHNYLDLVNLMTYDFRGGWSSTTGHHSNLYNAKGDAEPQSAQAAVDRFIKAGVPPEKIVVGVAFYGRGWKVNTGKNHGLFGEPYEELRNRNLSFDQIRDVLLNDKANKEYWDKSASAAYIVNRKENIFITWENERAVQEKVDFVKKNQLGGLMAWQYYHDSKGRLMSIMAGLKD